MSFTNFLVSDIKKSHRELNQALWEFLQTVIPLPKDPQKIVLMYCMLPLISLTKEWFVPPGKTVLSIETTVEDWVGNKLMCRLRSGTKNKDLYLEINDLNIIIRQTASKTIIINPADESRMLLPIQTEWRLTYTPHKILLESPEAKFEIAKFKNV